MKKNTQVMIALGVAFAGGLGAFLLSTKKSRHLLQKKAGGIRGDVEQFINEAREKFGAIGRNFCNDQKEPAGSFAREV